MRIAASSLNAEASHQLLKNCVIPRPIAWISTLGPDGVANAAPYSCFTFLATLPPIVGFSVEPRNGQKKDTLRNIEHAGDFVVNIVPEHLTKAMNSSAEDLPPEVDEISTAGLSACPSEKVRSPRIAECPINLECKVQQILELGRSRHSFVIAEVLLFLVADHLYKDGQIDTNALCPIGRMAGNQYVRLGDVFELNRPWLQSRAEER